MLAIVYIAVIWAGYFMIICFSIGLISHGIGSALQWIVRHNHK